MAPVKHEPKGQHYGHWTVLNEAPRRGKYRRMWLCRCDCGNEREIQISALVGGRTTSCGCKKTETLKRMATKHGLCRSPEYRAYNHLIDRCYNENDIMFKNYGGRGIRVCDRWLHSFENFYSDMGPRPSNKHSIDRENNDKDYCPENCRWATRKQQARNTTRTRKIMWRGEERAYRDVCDQYGLPDSTVRSRLKRGWDIERAITEPRR